MNNKYPEFEKLEIRDSRLKCGLAKGLLKTAQINPSLRYTYFEKFVIHLDEDSSNNRINNLN